MGGGEQHRIVNGGKPGIWDRLGAQNFFNLYPSHNPCTHPQKGMTQRTEYFRIGYTLGNVGKDDKVGTTNVTDENFHKDVTEFLGLCRNQDINGYGYQLRLLRTDADPTTVHAMCAVAKAPATCEDLVGHHLSQCQRNNAELPDRVKFFTGNNVSIAVPPMQCPKNPQWWELCTE